MYSVLIVEDDPMVAAINKQYVNQNKDFRVSAVCSDGKSAIDYLHKHDVSLMILDVYMPKMTGLELLREIRKENISVSVIMVTAANSTNEVSEALELGVVDYLIKPFTSLRFNLALENFKSRQNVLASISSCNQNSIDAMFNRSTVQETSGYPKGLQESTMNTIKEYISSHYPEEMTSEEIADNTGLSRVTVRRYVNYLVETGTVTERMNYETGGRPCMLYIWNK